ncbi:MAG: 4-hydroxythreonine-4-phosphate dehydrogenase PdxA [Chlorobi bacterium]|nr:4-hydroxythreonine-4-phosphate dehydrogenase PdxA [Chlorobiota bacterium]
MHTPQKTDKPRKPVVGITHGDLNGISYEIIIKALKDNRLFEMFTPVIYGLSKVLSYHRKNLNFFDFNYKVVRDARQIMNNKVNIVNISNDEVRIEYGKTTEVAGRLAYEALELAVNDLKENKIDVVVTAPINKSGIHSESFNFPGHTEYFTNRFNCEESLMLMVHENLKIGIVTSHIPLKEVIPAISQELITRKIKILNDSLIRDFGINRPKIAVLGINPHAGDNGLIGDEDEHIVSAAVISTKKSGMLVYGPFSADGFFGTDEYSRYDAILAMYHDQGLIPFKILAFDKGVNFTAGLPIVRTSPDHGTAYEIAGKNMASSDSLRRAIYLAVDILKNRRMFDEMTKDPLPSGLINEFGNGKNNKKDEELNEVED